jgi:hypothetical protein
VSCIAGCFRFFTLTQCFKADRVCYFQERTFVSAIGMSAFGHCETLTLSTTGPLLPLIADVWTDTDFVATGQLRDSCAATSLFDHLVGARDERGWDREPESLRGLQVNHEIELGWLLDRKLRRSGALQDLVNENRGHAVHLAS